jgi:hypothetical protein
LRVVGIGRVPWRRTTLYPAAALCQPISLTAIKASFRESLFFPTVPPVSED